MVMDSSRWLLQVPHNSGCFCMALSGYIWLLMLLKGFECLLPFLDGSGRFCPTCGLIFLRSTTH